MTRPHNETPRDLVHERNARAVVEREFDCEIMNLNENLYGLDWAMHRRSKFFAYGEYKFRGQDYDDFVLSAAKYTKGMLHAGSVVGVQFYFFLETPDSGLRYVNLSILPRLTTQMAGNSRGQSGDIEPCVMIPADAFKPINGS